MAVVFNAQSTAAVTGAAATSFTNSTNLTIGAGTSRALVVMMAWSTATAPTAISITWNGVALTQITGTVAANGTGGNIAMYGLLNPATGAQALAGSWTGARDFYVAAVAYNNVLQTSVATAFTNGNFATGTSTLPSQTLSSGLGDADVCSFSSSNGTTISVAGGTQVFLDNTQTTIDAAGVRAVGTTANAVMGGTLTSSVAWVANGVRIRAEVFPDYYIPQWREPVRFPPIAYRQQFIAVPQLPIIPPYAGWDDAVEWPRPPARRSMAYTAPFLAFVPTISATGTGTSGGTATDAGTRFKRTLVYQAIAQPVFVQPASTPYAGWDDASEWIRPPTPRSPAYSAPFLAFVPLPRQVWFPPNVYPDTFPVRAKPVVDFRPWTFVPSPVQVFYPYSRWDDFTRRKPQPLDTQPLAWPSTPVVATFPAMGWNNWPDFAPKRKPLPADVWPLAFVPLVPSANVIGDWPDFVRVAKRPLNYDPLAFVQTVQQVTTWDAWTQWPDFAPRKPVPLNFNPLAQVQLAPQVWYPPVQWPDRINKKPVPLNYSPLTLTQLAPQVFFPYAPWDDFTRRKPQPLDTQPLSWGAFTPAPAATFFLVPERWPDYIRVKTAPINYNPLTFVQTVQAPWTQWTQWPDRIWRKPQPVDMGPSTVLLQLIRVPWNELSRWPDFVPIRTKAGLMAALQQFSARFPGTISQATVTAIINAFEVNADTAAMAIYVIQSQPAVRAEVSIQEIGTI